MSNANNKYIRTAPNIEQHKKKTLKRILYIYKQSLNLESRVLFKTIVLIRSVLDFGSKRLVSQYKGIQARH